MTRDRLTNQSREVSARSTSNRPMKSDHDSCQVLCKVCPAGHRVTSYYISHIQADHYDRNKVFNKNLCQCVIFPGSIFKTSAPDAGGSDRPAEGGADRRPAAHLLRSAGEK